MSRGDKELDDAVEVVDDAREPEINLPMKLMALDGAFEATNWKETLKKEEERKEQEDKESSIDKQRRNE